MGKNTYVKYERAAAGKCQVLPVTKNLGLVHTGLEILEEIKKGGKVMMSVQKENPRRRFLRPEKLPHFFCSGWAAGRF